MMTDIVWLVIDDHGIVSAHATEDDAAHVEKNHTRAYADAEVVEVPVQQGGRDV